MTLRKCPAVGILLVHLHLPPRLNLRLRAHVLSDTISGGAVVATDFVVSNPDADHIGGFLNVFDAFEVETVYASGDPKGTLTYNTFLRAARDEGSRLESVRAGHRMDWGGVQADA